MDDLAEVRRNQQRPKGIDPVCRDFSLVRWDQQATFEEEWFLSMKDKLQHLRIGHRRKELWMKSAYFTWNFVRARSFLASNPSARQFHVRQRRHLLHRQLEGCLAERLQIVDPLCPQLGFCHSAASFHVSEEVYPYCQSFCGKGTWLIICIVDHGQSGFFLFSWVRGPDERFQFLQDVSCRTILRQLAESLFQES